MIRIMQFESERPMDDAFARFDERRLRRESERAALNKRLGELSREAEEDAIALRVLKSMYPDGIQRAGETAPVPARIKADTPAAGSPDGAGAGMRRKDMILTVVRDAYPSGMTAAQIKAKVF